jgi:hypothetical protein
MMPIRISFLPENLHQTLSPCYKSSSEISSSSVNLISKLASEQVHLPTMSAAEKSKCKYIRRRPEFTPCYKNLQNQSNSSPNVRPNGDHGLVGREGGVVKLHCSNCTLSLWPNVQKWRH